MKSFKASLLLALAGALAAPAGAVEIQPYGFLLSGYVQNWGRPNSIEVPATAASKASLGASSEREAAFTARQSRVGLALSGGKGPLDSELSGAVEMDFYGLRNSASASFDVLASAPRLRLAYVQAKRGSTAVVFGQDWDQAFAPLNPSSLMHTAVAPLTQAGNLWNRTPQLRWDQAWLPGAGWTLNTKLALVRAFTADQTGRTASVPTAPASSVVVPSALDAAGSGEFSAGPAYQGLAEMRKDFDGRTFVAGVSAQYLRQSFNAALPAPAGAANGSVGGWLWAAHFVLPVLPALELSGEAFYGRGDQGLNGLGFVYNNGGSVEQALVRGGWAQASYKPAKGWKVDLMGGWENADQAGLAAAALRRNEAYAANVIWSAAPELTLGLEAGYIRSYYVSTAAGESQNLGLTAQYKFGR